MATTILIIEQETAIALRLEKILKKKGYNILPVCSQGRGAVTLARRLKPDLVLIDKGLENEIDAKTLTTPIIFLTKPINENDLCIVIDLTLFKHHAEEILRLEMQRMRSEFISNITHEFHTPLNGIIGFANLLYKGMITQPEVSKDCLENILTSAERLLSLIDKMLAFSAIEAGKIQFYPVPVDIAKLVQEVMAELQVAICQKKISLIISIKPPKKIIIDPQKFKQILFNYLSNAIKFSHTLGKVMLTIKPEDQHHFRLEVKDHGPGINTAELKQIFLPFHSLDQSIAKRDPDHAGVNLALVQRLVEAQGGYVGASSILERETLFFAVLPCTPPQDTLEVKSNLTVKHVP